LAAILREALDADIDEPRLDDAVDEVAEHPVTRSARRRDALDALFQGLLRPGNRLELYDGLHSKEAVEAAIAPTFEGVIDLTTCTSTVLADHVSAKRRFRLRTIQFPTVQDVLWGANCVKAALQIQHTTGVTYQEARQIAYIELEKAVRAVPTGAR
jgi:hypothetical protein